MIRISEADARNVALNFVRELGMTLTPEAESELAASVHDALRIDPDSRAIVMVDPAGNPMPKVGIDGTVSDLSPKEFVAQAAARLGAKPKAKSQPQSKGGMTTTQRAKATVAALRSPEHRKSLAAAEAARGENPWKAGHINRSRQAIITNCDPALAARLRHEVGASR